jgi:restriction system protein
MAVPDFQSFLLPLLKLASDGNEHSIAEAVEKMAQAFQLSDEDRTELLPSGKQTRITNRVGWALTYLRKAGLLSTVQRGSFQLTERGRQVLAEAPPRIDLKFLQSRFPEIGEFRREEEDDPAKFSVNEGMWSTRPGLEEKIRERFERFLPDAAIRRSALELFAFAIETPTRSAAPPGTCAIWRPACDL